MNYTFSKSKGHAKHLCGFILDLLFPIECLKCKTPGEWLCKQCFRKLGFNDKAFCLHCYKESNLGEFCSNCKDKFSLNGVMIAGSYDNKLIAKLIKTLKYNFNRQVSQILGDYMSIFLNNNLNQRKIKNKAASLFDFDNTILIPVPLHKKRLKWRGFNQSELLTKAIGEKFKFEINTKNLKRLKHNTAQAKLKGKKRYNNLKNNFSWQGPTLFQKNIILVDDIVTTGTTLNECAVALKKAGANEVWGLVAAKG